MRTQTRLLLGVAAVILALAGALVGWLVAVSRQATPSDAIVSAILTGAFTLLGAGIGLVVPLLQDWERNRPNLKLQLSYRCLHASPTGLRMASELFPSTITAATGPPLMYTWKRCKPEEPTASLVLFLDLQVQNRGYLDDAITELTSLGSSGVSISASWRRVVRGVRTGVDTKTASAKAMRGTKCSPAGLIGKP